MTVAFPQPDVEISPIAEGVAWETYFRLRRDLDEAGSVMRVTYDRGRMVLMSPLPRHAKWSRLIGQMIEALADERGLAISAFGNTTWQREDLRRGLEADECYYIQTTEAIRGKLDIELGVDPPPDLGVEVEVTHHPLDKPSIYAALGVPELWRYDGEQLEVLTLDDKGAYAPATSSRAFPKFDPRGIPRFLSMFPASLDREIINAFRQWVRSQP